VLPAVGVEISGQFSRLVTQQLRGVFYKIRKGKSLPAGSTKDSSDA
jgi:hypothetical protein